MKKIILILVFLLGASIMVMAQNERPTAPNDKNGDMRPPMQETMQNDGTNMNGAPKDKQKDSKSKSSMFMGEPTKGNPSATSHQDGGANGPKGNAGGGQPGGKQKQANPLDQTKVNLRPDFNDNVGKKLNKRWNEMSASMRKGQTRNIFKNTISTVAYNATTSFIGLIDTGIGLLVKSLFHSSKQDQQEWQKMLENENRFSKPIGTQEIIKDFYTEGSIDGAMDPSNMQFNGFKLSQYRGDSLVFYFSCHVDTTEQGINELVNHSKFILAVDTLYFKPSLCDLPNDSTSRLFSEKRHFSWAEKDNLSVTITANVTSSWINEAIEVYKDVNLGTFTYTFPISQSKLNAEGAYYYIPDSTEHMQGDCFIVPRSYVGMLNNETNKYMSAWGTGQYKVNASFTETCSVSNKYIEQLKKEGWKADYKRRKKNSKDGTFSQFLIEAKKVFDPQTQLTSILEIPVNIAVGTGIGSVLNKTIVGDDGQIMRSGNQGGQGNQSGNQGGQSNQGGNQGGQGNQGGNQGGTPGGQGGAPQP